MSSTSSGATHHPEPTTQNCFLLSPFCSLLSAFLLSHAEGAEHPVENVLDIHGADQLLEGAGCGTEMYRGDGCRQRACRSSLLEERDFIARTLHGAAMTFAGE